MTSMISNAAVTLDEIVEIGEGLLDQTLPADRFHHREHLLATAYLMRCRPQMDLRQELPDIIRRFNLAKGGKNTEDSGYHQTITLFYIAALERLFSSRPKHELAQLCKVMLASPLACKDFPLRFYSRELLFSKEARRVWIAPDLQNMTELQAAVLERSRTGTHDDMI